MKINNLIESNYYYGMSDKDQLTESLNNVISMIDGKVSVVMDMMRKGEEKTKVEQAIVELASKYKSIYVAIRTIISVEEYMRNREDDESGAFTRSMTTIAALLSNKVDTVRKALKAFYERFKKNKAQNQGTIHGKVTGTLTGFENTANNDLKRKEKEFDYVGSAFIVDFKKHLTRVMQSAHKYIDKYKELRAKRDEKVSETFFIEYFTDLEDRGLLENFNSLNESTSVNTKGHYFSIVEACVYEGERKVRNFTTIVGTMAESPKQACKTMNKNLKASTRQINKAIKSNNRVVKYKDVTESKVRYGIDAIRKATPQKLPMYSKGMYLMKGITEDYGKESDIVEHAPYHVKRLSSKASVSRYLNREI